MRRQDWTGMGGVQEKFLTTHWSLLQDLKGAEEATSRALIELLLERYWKPVYCYLRRKGYANEQAKDLTQGFFHEVVLNRRLFERADPDRGSFRSLLLHALHQYLTDQQRRESAGKRIPPERVVHLEAVDPVELPQFVAQLDPDESFNYTWKADLLERVLTEVRTDYTDRGMETHWLIFRDRLLAPLLQDQAVPSMRELCTRYGIDKQASVSHMLTTVKRHFQTVLRSQVRQTVLDGQSVEEELQDILRFLRP
jgi:DNA-directed RNA polymerase specialized sigma24 family protein